MNADLYIAPISGGLAGLLIWFCFRRLPSHWLLEYGETDIPDELRQIQRLPLLPDALFLSVFTAIIALIARLRLPSGIDLTVFALSSSVLLLILVADWKTQIIPDPLTFALIGLSLLKAGLGLISSSRALALIGFDLLAGLAAAVFLGALGWIGEKIAGQEAMGMGDVKLIAACIWLAGYEQALGLVFLAFLLASVLAFPMLIRKYFGRRPNPLENQPENDQKSASDAVPTHLPQDVLPFGPFIVVATLMVQILKPELIWLSTLYLGQFR